MLTNRWAALIALIFAAVFSLPQAMSAPLPKPDGPVLISLTGNLTVTNDGQIAQFDRSMLEALDWREIDTAKAGNKLPDAAQERFRQLVQHAPDLRHELVVQIHDIKRDEPAHDHHGKNDQGVEPENVEN